MEINRGARTSRDALHSVGCSRVDRRRGGSCDFIRYFVVVRTRMENKKKNETENKSTSSAVVVVRPGAPNVYT